MRRLLLPALLAALAACGCAKPDAPALQPGDVVRPEVSFAPKEPWPAGGKAIVGVLVRVERPGDEPHYLMDEDVDIERAVMGARVTFFDGELVLGEPRDVTLVHDC